jgi:ribose transport system substrate-binding protein
MQPGGHRFRLASLTGALIAFSAVLATVIPSGPSAAANSSCKPHAIDIGKGISITGGCAPLKIAYLSSGSNNAYVASAIRGVDDEAKKDGATVEVFDANWNAVTQYKLTQDVIASGRFNAIVAQMVDGNQACAILTKDAPAHNILVAVNNQPLCGRAGNEGVARWAPGTLTYVAGNLGHLGLGDWLYSIAKQNPGPQKVIILTGPDLNANVIAFDLAIKDLKAKYPEFKVVAEVRTDWTIAPGNQKATAVLEAHPDATILIGEYSDVTRGAVQAVKAAGMAGKLKIYDYGGNKWAYQAVKDGQIISSLRASPYSEAARTVDALADAWKGEQVPRSIQLKTLAMTPQTLDTVKPEY